MGNTLAQKIKYWAQIFLLPLYGLSYLMPRSKKIWAFGSTFGRRFADNPRYFYTYLHAHPEQGIRAIWFSHNKEVVSFLQKNGYEAYYYHSLKGIWYALRARIYIFDNYSKDINFWQSAGAVKLNLWHGTGNKRANHDNVFDTVRHPKNLWGKWKTFPRRLSDEKPWHYTLATSKPLAKITSSAFDTPLSHVIIDGYPRNDKMLNEKFPNILLPIEQECIDKIREYKENGNRIDLYMPTFRSSETDFFRTMDLKKFNDFLKKEKIVFVVKLHPKSKLKKEFAALSYSHIYNIDAEVDPYVFMNTVDVLTTDYSSVYSDFMLLDRPVVAFHYDYERYVHETRDSYVPHDEYMPEHKAVTMAQLMTVTKKVLQRDDRKEARAASRNRMFLYQDAHATERLVVKAKRLCGGRNCTLRKRKRKKA